MNSENLAESIQWTDYSDKFRNLSSSKNRNLSKRYRGGEQASTSVQPVNSIQSVLQTGGKRRQQIQYFMPSFLISNH